MKFYCTDNLKTIHTLQAFCKGSKNVDLKSLIAFPNEVPFHSAIKQGIKISSTSTGLQLAVIIRRHLTWVWQSKKYLQNGNLDSQQSKINIPPLTSALEPSLLSSSRSCNVTNHNIRIHITI